MLIKYKCFDHNKKEFRHPDPNNMVSMFTPNGDDEAMRIVAPEGFELIIWTGFTDINNRDIYPGDILDDKVCVKWDIQAGAWGLYERGKGKLYRFANYGSREITGNVYENPKWLDKE